MGARHSPAGNDFRLPLRRQLARRPRRLRQPPVLGLFLSAKRLFVAAVVAAAVCAVLILFMQTDD